MKFLTIFLLAFNTQILFAQVSSCDWTQNCAAQLEFGHSAGGFAGGSSYRFSLVHDSTDIAMYETLHQYQCVYKYKMQDPHPSNESCLDVFDSLTPEQWVCSTGLANGIQHVTKFNFGIGANDFSGTPQGNRRYIRFVHRFNLPDNVENCEETATGVKCRIIGCIEQEEGPQDPTSGLQSGNGEGPRRGRVK
jgi:hypothetical protein